MSQSLLNKYLSDALTETLSTRRTSMGVTLSDVIRSGQMNADSHIGLYAGDAESYQTFAELFAPIIEEYHAAKNTDVDYALRWSPSTDVDLSFAAPLIRSTRIRVCRNLQNYPFPTMLTKEQRYQVEEAIVAALQTLPTEYSGTYYRLSELTEKEYQHFVDSHLLFRKGDRFQESAGMCRDWPEGRGFYLADDRRFIAWVNEEDHLRIIAMQDDCDLEKIYRHLLNSVAHFEKNLTFAYSDQYGYLTSCPTNIGTTMRASVHIDLSKIDATDDFKKTCESLKLSVRGVDGEFTDSPDHIYDISNKQRLGLTTLEAISTLKQGLLALLE